VVITILEDEGVVSVYSTLHSLHRGTSTLASFTTNLPRHFLQQGTTTSSFRSSVPNPSLPTVRNERDKESRFKSEIPHTSYLGSGMTVELPNNPHRHLLQQRTTTSSFRSNVPNPSFPTVRDERDRESHFGSEIPHTSPLGSGMTIELPNSPLRHLLQQGTTSSFSSNVPNPSFPTVRDERDRESVFCQLVLI
jgi:hypothetical protein